MQKQMTIKWSKEPEDHFNLMDLLESWSMMINFFMPGDAKAMNCVTGFGNPITIDQVNSAMDVFADVRQRIADRNPHGAFLLETKDAYLDRCTKCLRILEEMLPLLEGIS